MSPLNPSVQQNMHFLPFTYGFYTKPDDHLFTGPKYVAEHLK